MEEKMCYHCFARYPTGEQCPHCGYDSAADAGKYPLALPHGSILNGRYIVGRALGQGGFGITYVAQDVQTGERVAIKEYFPETMATRTGSHNVTAFSGQRQENFAYGMQCFLSEAQTLAQFIGAENIVRVHSYFEENGTAYFVMDYVDGVSFQAYLKQRGGRVSWEEARRILLPVMEALSIVHSKGIIHRDIAPDNIYITASGQVKLLDFGAARYSLGDRSRSLDVVLKAGYAPKEQYTRRGRQGPYTDVYSLAATLYYAITGRVPPEAIDRMDEDDLILPSSQGVQIPMAAEDALEKALSVQAPDRYQTMADFRQALTAEEPDFVPQPVPAPAPDPIPPRQPVSAPQPAPAPQPKPEPVPQPVPEPKPQPAPRKKPSAKIIALVAALAVVLLGAAGYFLTADSRAYDEAMAALSNEDYDLAYDLFKALGDYEDSQTMASEARYQKAVGLMNSQEFSAAEQVFSELGSYRDSKNQLKRIRNLYYKGEIISAGGFHTVGLKVNGTVVAAGRNAGNRCEVASWKDIIAVSAGWLHTVGLKSDGRVVAAGDDSHGQCNVSGWKDIIAISAGVYHTVGLKSDGTVVAAGFDYYDQCDVSGWKDIIAVSAGDFCTVGLKRNGEVIATGVENYGQCNVSGWKDIIAVSAKGDHTVGLKSDGTVVATGKNNDGQCNVSGWKDIIAISAGVYHTVGLKSDGTVVATGSDFYDQCDVSGWKDIIAVSAGGFHTVGLKSDGTVVAVGVNDDGQCDVSSWTNIGIPQN